MIKNSNSGILNPINVDHNEIYNVPYVRGIEFIKRYFENKITKDEYQDLKKKVFLLVYAKFDRLIY